MAALRNAGGDGLLEPRHVADVLGLLADGTVSGAGAKEALAQAHATGEPIARIVDAKGLRQVSDTGALATWADEVIAEHPDVVEKFRGGKEGVIGFLVGALMKKAAGAANPKLAQEVLRERLQSGG